MQMAGDAGRRILWGILGDRKGRLKIMFASIFLYSVANAGQCCGRHAPAYAICALWPGSAWPGNWGPASPWWRDPA